MENNEFILPLLLIQIILFIINIYLFMMLRNDFAELRKIQYENGTIIYDSYNNTQAIRNYFMEELPHQK